MSFFSGGETVVITRRTAGANDDYGNPTFTTTSITVKNCLIGFGSTSEPIDVERDAVDAKITIYFPIGTTVQDGDRFTIRNSVWEKDGNVTQYVPPFAMSVGPVVMARQRRG